MNCAPKSRRRRFVALAAVFALICTGTIVADVPAGADNVTVSDDTLRTGWDQNESGLAPSSVSASDFGQLFATQLDGQIYAQPIVAKSTVLAVTENDKIYGLNSQTGAIKWSRDVGPYWPASNIGCGDLVPNIGITGTPVYDPATGTAYFTAKVNDGADGNHPHWYLHAIDITTGAERPNFPATIGGSPSNDPGNTFNPKTAMQRPGLLLLGGVVYAGFASHCDYGPYVGYVAGVNASTGKQTTLWSTEAGSSNSEAGIWQSGGGLVSDGAGRIILATGNGVSAAPGPGTQPPSTLAEAVVRLQVGSDGNLTAKDFFSPVNNSNLDREDADLGSGGPMAIPDGYGTSAHPHLLVEVGKDGRVFLLDRDNLGGVGQGAGGTDGALQVAGPYNGVWGHPAFWGGDGGYVYTITNGGPLLAFKTGVAGNGLPALTKVGSSTANWGYTSGSPVVTSTGTTSGSSLIWAIYSSGSNGSGGQLRAYDTVPTNGVLNQRYSAPIGTASKFAVPATDGGRVYVGNRDGVLYGFGRPTTAALSGSPTDFGNVAVNSTSTKNVTVTATRTVTVTGVSTAAPFKAGSVSLPATLNSGQSLTVPVTFAPTATGAQSGALSFATNAGTLAFDLHGAGTQPGLAGNPASLAFGQVPTSGKVTQSISITNTGSTTTTITGATAPSAPFSAGSLPANGTTLAAGASVSVPITFAPSKAGDFSSALTVTSSTGNVSVPISGTGIAGAPHMTLSPTTVAFGSVPVGSTASKTFTISNTGNTVLTLNKAAPPAAPFGAPSPVSEGQQINPGDEITQTVTFAPTTTGAVSGSYLITGNDNQGAQTVTLTGTGTSTGTGTGTGTIPSPAAGGWHANGSAVQNGATTTLTPATETQAGNVVYPTAVPTAGLHVKFTAQLNGGTGADGLAFDLLDPAKNTSTSLGKTGGALGFGSLTGTAVALDTYRNTGDPSANFYGIATGATGGGSDSLTYAASAPAPTSLRSGTHTVDVAVTSTGLSVSLDGGTPLTAKVTVPAKALLAFSAGTGGETDVHAVTDVVITTVPPSGAITGIAGKCVDVSGANTADGTKVQLYTCNGTNAQVWTFPGNNTIHALGKCLDVNQAAKTNGTKVQLYTCNGTVAQVWNVESNGEIVNPNSGRCLDDPGSKTADGTGLEIYDCNAGANQTWQVPAGASAAAPTAAKEGVTSRSSKAAAPHRRTQ
ncbi:choice-of-anchor D domain-containing protein [uncultured Jatrophihabitans sp.]|uniref:choice-of-anchor D domain-containing protein n=1 Tax=uncultured Jatrophihabitans sp. TaxID=1610747 RepID=UPI0035C99192